MEVTSFSMTPQASNLISFLCFIVRYRLTFQEDSIVFCEIVSILSALYKSVSTNFICSRKYRSSFENNESRKRRLKIRRVTHWKWSIVNWKYPLHYYEIGIRICTYFCIVFVISVVKYKHRILWIGINTATSFLCPFLLLFKHIRIVRIQMHIIYIRIYRSCNIAMSGDFQILLTRTIVNNYFCSFWNVTVFVCTVVSSRDASYSNITTY